MTYQDFNYIYYRFTKNKRGIRPYDRISTDGYELKEFVELAIDILVEEGKLSDNYMDPNFNS